MYAVIHSVSQTSQTVSQLEERKKKKKESAGEREIWLDSIENT